MDWMEGRHLVSLQHSLVLVAQNKEEAKYKIQSNFMSVQIPNMFVIEKAETGQFLRREAIMLKTRKENS